MRSRAIALAHEAVEQSPDDPEAVAYGGYAMAFFEDAPGQGMALVERAISLSPNLAMAWTLNGWLQNFHGDPRLAVKNGDPRLAVKNFETSMRLDPIDPLQFRAKTGMAIALLFQRNFSHSFELARQAYDQAPGYFASLRVLIAALAQLHRMDEAHALAKKVHRGSANFSHLRLACQFSDGPRSEHCHMERGLDQSWTARIAIRSCRPAQKATLPGSSSG